MVKKIWAGLAAAALSAGMFVAAAPAHADFSDWNTALCEIKDGKNQINCSIKVESDAAAEGSTVKVTVTGAAVEDLTLAVYAIDVVDANTVRFGKQLTEPVKVTWDGETATAEIQVPKLDETMAGGEYVVAPGDAKEGDDWFSDGVFTIWSENAAFKNATPNRETGEFTVDLTLGWPGDEYNLQANVNGEWKDFTVKGEAKADEKGDVTLTVVPPEVEKGQYDVRVKNVSKDSAGPVQAKLYLGVEPEDEPTPDVTVSPEPSVSPSAEAPSEEPSNDDSASPAPSASETDKPAQPAKPAKPSKPSKPGKPGLPRTGVAN